MLSVPLLCAALIALDPTAYEPWRQDIDKFEASIAAFEELDRTEEYPDDSILFVGSSSIRLWETLAEDMAPYPVIQRGYGGAKFSDLAYFADRIISPHDFRAVVTFVANDVSGKKSDKPPEETAKFFRHVLSVVRKQKPQVPVFLIAVTPTAARWEVWDKTQATNAALRDVIESDPNGHFITTSPFYFNDDRRPRTELFVDDKLHLNQQGYRLWAAIIRQHLEAVLGQPQVSFEPWQADIEKWRPAMEEFDEMNRTQPDPEDAILVVGSSSIRLWVTMAEDMQPYKLIRRGYGGAKYSDLAFYAERIITPHEFKALVLFVGNDVSGSETDKQPHETIGYLQQVIDVARKAEPDTPIFVIGVTPTPKRFHLWPQIDATNQTIRALCESRPGLYFIATADHFLTDEGTPHGKLFRDDQLHLNADGYALWQSLIKAELAKRLSSKAGS